MKTQSFIHTSLILFLLTMCQTIQAQIATITHMAGEVSLNRGTAVVGDKIYPGSRITVKGEKSWVDLRYNQGHIVRGTEGEFIVEVIDEKKSLIDLVKGKLFAWVAPLGKKESFKIKTKRVSMGVRGTKFMTEESEQKTYLCVCEGTVETTRGNESVLVNKGNDLDVIDGQKMLVKKSTSMMNTMLLDMMKNIETTK